MPTYQYRCADCGHFFETVQSFSEDSLTECPECRGTLRKVFNAVGVVFKGSGFYKNDSRGKSGGSGGSSGSGSESSGSSGNSSSSDSGSSSASGSSTKTDSGPKSAPSAPASS